MCDGEKRCTRYPVYTVSIHRVDECNKPPGPEGVYQMCPACTRAVADRIKGIIESGVGFPCLMCLRWVASLHDIFTVEWIEESRKGQAAAG